jgi:hypothetical protein
MKTFTICLLGLLVPSLALATIDSDFDQLGVYFDLGANEVCASAEPGIHVITYVILTNPSAPEVSGIEFSYRLGTPSGHESSVLRHDFRLPPGTIDLDIHQIMGGWCVLTFSNPLPVATGAVVILEWEFSLVEEIPVDFHLGASPFDPLGNGLPAYVAGGVLRQLGVASGDPNRPVAAMNVDCVGVVSTESTEFGAVKALFR